MADTTTMMPTAEQIKASQAVFGRYLASIMPKLLQKWLESPEGQAQFRAAFDSIYDPNVIEKMIRDSARKSA
jgi:hypothetical protein